MSYLKKYDSYLLDMGLHITIKNRRECCFPWGENWVRENAVWNTFLAIFLASRRKNEKSTQFLRTKK